MRRPFTAALLLVSLCSCASTRLRAGGSAAAEGRVFFVPPKYPGQAFGHGVSLVMEPTVELTIKEDRHRFTLQPFYRLDPVDERRSHGDVREASYRFTRGRWRLSVGAGLFSWGVLESYRPTDVLNQTDFVESIDGMAKLGQPHAELAYLGDTVSFQFYYLPYFRQRTFQGIHGRPRFPLVIDTDHPEYESSLGPFHPSAAARLLVRTHGLDLGLGLFTGLSREPRFIYELTADQLTPRYDLAHRASLDLQWARSGFTLKAEGYFSLYSNQLKVFGGGGAGIDYTFFSFVRSADLTLAAEFLFDTRTGATPVALFKHDAFAGLRLAVNDTGNTELSAGAIVDVLDAATFARIDLSRRLGDHVRISLGAHLYFGRAGTLNGAFNQDHYGYLQLAYFF